LPVLLLSSSVMSLGCFVDSFIGVFHWCPILLGPCNLCCATRTVDGPAWVRTFLFFLCSCIMHVSVSAVIAIVIVPICRRMGVMGWLGDISHWVSGVSCYSPRIHGSLRYLLLVRDDSSILSINTSSVMLPFPKWAPSRNYHDMTDSSLTTPLPHLKVYKHHMGGLAVSGSHGLRESSEKSGNQHSLRTPCW
jgi:hypothetical protein